MTTQAAWLLAALMVGHFLGDFTPLVTRRMLDAKAQGAPLGPIAAHAGIHGLLAAIAATLVLGAAPTAVLTAFLAVLVTHFCLDAGRAHLGRRLPALQDSMRQSFWVALGLDQLAHGLVLLGLVSWIA